MAQQGRGTAAHLAGAHADDDCQAARGVLGVEGRDEGDELRGVHLVADLDADGVGNASHELYVRRVQLPRPLPAPQEVPRAVVPAARGASA